MNFGKMAGNNSRCGSLQAQDTPPGRIVQYIVSGILGRRKRDGRMAVVVMHNGGVKGFGIYVR